MRVYLLRHGVPPEATAEGRYSGRLDTPLSPAGRQACIGRHFRRSMSMSPLRRAVETAALWFRKRNRFRCRSCGKWIFGLEGAPGRSFPDNAAYRAWVDSGCQAPIPGRESKAVFCARYNAVAALDWEAARQTDTVVVAHGGTLMAALSVLACPRRRLL